MRQNADGVQGDLSLFSRVLVIREQAIRRVGCVLIRDDLQNQTLVDCVSHRRLRVRENIPRSRR